MIYRQTFEQPIQVDVSATAIDMLAIESLLNGDDGCIQVPCADGCVDGLYQHPDGSWHDCVDCKGTGLMWVNLW